MSDVFDNIKLHYFETAMLHISAFNLDKLIHSIMQNFDYGRTGKKHFLTYMDKTCKVQNKQLNIYNKMKDIYPSNLDFSSSHDIQNFVEKHTNILDKSIYTKNILFPASYLQNINTQIIQKLNKIQSKRGIIENKHKLLNTCKQNFRSKIYQGTSYNKHLIKNTASKQHKNFISDIKKSNKNESSDLKYNLTTNIVQYMQYEIKLNNKALQLYTKDTNFIKRHVHVSLYIAAEDIDSTNIKSIDRKYQQVNLLCKQAILCLIEPSERAHVFYTNNLSTTIHNHLSQGCKYHFESPSNSKQPYKALLIISHWAKFLMRRPDITMIRIICAILGCEINKILILYYPEDCLSRR